LRDGAVEVRPLRLTDAPTWRRVRTASAGWLIPWEATAPGRWAPRSPSLGAFAATWWRLRRQAAAGEALPFTVLHHGELAGQVTVGGITRREAARSAYVGYWVDEARAGRGIIPTALALVIDHCFEAVGLDRIEANIRPENTASRRVVDKLGFTLTGTRQRFLYIDGEWRDHLCYVVARDDVPEGMVARWHARRDQPA
jgi:ribosomal-protein-alanine N-acetyltransferase